MLALTGARPLAERGGGYSVTVLGDTHFDAEPDSIYHSNYRNEGKAEWLWKVQRKEFARNGEMWRDRCRRLLAASGAVTRAAKSTDFVLQLGDLVQGDCDDAATHKKMLDDCIRMMRAEYPAGLPFLTVAGNHDFRGIGANDAYFEYAEPFLSRQLDATVKYPAFSFYRGPDLWIFCHFEAAEMTDLVRLIDSGRSARHVFLVTHGPFTPGESTSWRWRLGGWCNRAYRMRLFDALLRSRAVVLSGHTHQTAWWRIANERGSYSEFTANAVWADPKLATAEPIASAPEDYGRWTLGRFSGKNAAADAAAYREDISPFKKDLKEYFFSLGAGHSRLLVDDRRVAIEYYPGDATAPARTFTLKEA